MLKIGSDEAQINCFFFIWKICDIFKMERNRILFLNVGNFGSKPQAMRGLLLGIFVQKHWRGEAFFRGYQFKKRARRGLYS